MYRRSVLQSSADAHFERLHLFVLTKAYSPASAYQKKSLVFEILIVIVKERIGVLLIRKCFLSSKLKRIHNALLVENKIHCGS
jgi:hypothetical protein